MTDRNTWFPSVGAIGVAAFGLALFGDADLASSQELKRIESAALERFAMHSNFEEGGMWTHYVPKDLNGEFDRREAPVKSNKSSAGTRTSEQCNVEVKTVLAKIPDQLLFSRTLFK